MSDDSKISDLKERFGALVFSKGEVDKVACKSVGLNSRQIDALGRLYGLLQKSFNVQASDVDVYFKADVPGMQAGSSAMFNKVTLFFEEPVLRDDKSVHWSVIQHSLAEAFKWPKSFFSKGDQNPLLTVEVPYIPEIHEDDEAPVSSPLS